MDDLEHLAKLEEAQGSVKAGGASLALIVSEGAAKAGRAGGARKSGGAREAGGAGGIGEAG